MLLPKLPWSFVDHYIKTSAGSEKKYRNMRIYLETQSGQQASHNLSRQRAEQICHKIQDTFRIWSSYVG